MGRFDLAIGKKVPKEIEPVIKKDIEEEVLFWIELHKNTIEEGKKRGSLKEDTEEQFEKKLRVDVKSKKLSIATFGIICKIYGIKVTPDPVEPIYLSATIRNTVRAGRGI
jgi:hypothetical protein